jgi:hypothetical protein
LKNQAEYTTESTTVQKKLCNIQNIINRAANESSGTGNVKHRRKYLNIWVE